MTLHSREAESGGRPLSCHNQWETHSRPICSLHEQKASHLCLQSQIFLEDTFQHIWNSLETYVFPTFAIIRRKFNKAITSEGFFLILVAPL